jgi:hypothetical protein
MAVILPGAGRQNKPETALLLVTPALPGYFSLAVGRFEMPHAPILTAPASELVSLAAKKYFQQPTFSTCFGQNITATIDNIVPESIV